MKYKARWAPEPIWGHFEEVKNFQSIQRLAADWTARGSKMSRTHPDRPWGPPSLLYDGYRVFPGVKRPDRGVDHPPPSSAEVKERVELYLYSPPGTSWPLLGRTLPLPSPEFEHGTVWPIAQSVLCAASYISYSQLLRMPSASSMDRLTPSPTVGVKFPVICQHRNYSSFSHSGKKLQYPVSSQSRFWLVCFGGGLRRVSSVHKIKQQALESQNTTILYYILYYITLHYIILLYYIIYNYIILYYIILYYIQQTMVTANNYMFRPLTGHHQVVHSMKMVEGCTIYNVTSV